MQKDYQCHIKSGRILRSQTKRAIEVERIINLETFFLHNLTLGATGEISVLGSISSTFYVRLFHTKVSRGAFFVLAVKVKLFVGARILAQMRSKNIGEIDSRRLS
jgi:hypothetical protein